MRCRKGHDLTPETTYYGPSGQRRCRTCCRINDHARNLRLAAARRRAAQCSLDFTPAPAPAPVVGYGMSEYDWELAYALDRLWDRKAPLRAAKAARRAAEAQHERGEHRLTVGEYVAALRDLRRPVDSREWLEPAA